MSSSQVREMLSGLFRGAPVNKLLGLTLEYDSDGTGVCRLPRNPNLDHGGHDTHGGIISTLLDAVGWFTVAAACGQAVVTSDINVRLLQAAKQQDLVATAKIIRMGSRSIVAEMTAKTAAGDLVAMATASFARLGELPPPA
jgi:uncharacterized protein (TIGR00369 family)